MTVIDPHKAMLICADALAGDGPLNTVTSGDMREFAHACARCGAAFQTGPWSPWTGLAPRNPRQHEDALRSFQSIYARIAQ